MVSTIITKNLYRSVIHFSSIQKASSKKSYSDFSLRYSLWNPVRHLLHVPEPQLHIPIFWTRQGKKYYQSKIALFFCLLNYSRASIHSLLQSTVVIIAIAVMVWLLNWINSHLLLLFFFLPFTCFSRLLSLWLRTEAGDILWTPGFDDGSTGNGEAGSCLAATCCLSASSRSKEEGGVVLAGATGISGRPKNFFTPGALSAENRNKTVILKGKKNP